VLTSSEPIADLDTAWTLGHARGYFDAVEIGEDGVAGMDEALSKLLARYPYLADEPLTAADDDEPPAKPSGRPMNAKPATNPTAGNQSLMKSCPTLSRRVRAPR
jgi:hypothetical protein